MRVLLGKDRVWLAAFAAIGFGFNLSALLADGARDVWILNPHEYEQIAAVLLGGLALALGLFGALADELRGVKDYVRQRPVSAERLFAARQLGAALVLLAWVFPPLLLHHWLGSMTSRAAALFEAGRIARYASLELAVCALTYATGALVGALSRRPVAAVAAGALAAAGSIFFGFLVAEPALAAPGRWLPVALALAAPMLLGACFAEREGHDADRPWTLRRTIVGGGVTALLVALTASGIVYGYQRGVHAVLGEIYPRPTEEQPGRFILTVSRGGGADEPDRLFEVGADHAALRELQVGRWPWRWSPSKIDHEGWGGRPGLWSDVPLTRPRIIAYQGGSTWSLTPEHRKLQHVKIDGATGVLEKRSIGKGSAQAGFSARAQIVGERHATTGRLYVYDPADRTIWSVPLNADAQHFSATPLPGGDKYVGQVHELEHGVYRTVLRGERGFYRVTEAGIVTLSPEEQARLATGHGRPRPTFTVALPGADPLAFTVVAHDTRGAEVFRHHYAPRTFAERATALALQLGALARPPVLQTASAFELPSEVVTYADVRLLDVLVAGGKRPWLLALVWAVGLGLAAATARRLRQAGAAPSTWIFWSATVALLGVPGWLTCRLLAPARAFRAVEVPAVPEPQPLLLQSA